MRFAARVVDAAVELEDGLRFESVVPDSRGDFGVGTEVGGDEAKFLRAEVSEEREKERGGAALRYVWRLFAVCEIVRRWRSLRRRAMKESRTSCEDKNVLRGAGGGR